MQLRQLKMLKYAVLNAECLLIVFVKELWALYHTLLIVHFLMIVKCTQCFHFYKLFTINDFQSLIMGGGETGSMYVQS